ncbi:MAG: DUF4238 domain-containing protein [Rhodococcus sp. (in: high G+C Gram-positive bacteria)]
MKHDHHTAPRYYLKAFRIPDEPAFIWEYHRGTPYNPGRPGKDRNPVKRSLDKASVKKDYYGNYEDHLAAREETAKPVFEKLRTTPSSNEPLLQLLTRDEKATLTDYIGLFMKRTTAREERLPEIWKTVRPRELIKLEHKITALMNQGQFTKARQLQDEKRKYEHDLPEELRQASIIEPYDRVRQRMIELPWTFLTIDKPILLTSDNPVRFPENEGLGHDLAFLTFPISPTITLFAATKPAANLLELPTASNDCSTTTMTARQASMLNHFTITGAHNYLYSHEANEDTTKSLG